jgi:hypothetical protein
MIKKALHTIALLSCFLGISTVTACTDGIWSPRGYIPEDGYDDDMPPPPPEAPPPPPHKAANPDFIQRILNEKDMIVPEMPPPPPPKPAPKHPEPDLLDAS